jgi:hypothetical protein
MAEVARIVEAGPEREKDRVVRWRRVDLNITALIAEPVHAIASTLLENA